MQPALVKCYTQDSKHSLPIMYANGEMDMSYRLHWPWLQGGDQGTWSCIAARATHAYTTCVNWSKLRL